MSVASPPAVAAHRWTAPDEWHSIDFISDLHLSPSLPRTTALWAGYLAETSADAVCMLGDLFEVWVGDDARSLGFEQSMVQAMAAAATRRHLFFMPGNRDFLVGPTMLESCHLTGLSDPTLLKAWGRRILLTHGDALCLADRDYQQFRRMVRGDDWQRDFLARSLAERTEIAGHIRRESTMRRRFDGNAEGDLDRSACNEWMTAHRATTLIHGHTHRPQTEALESGRTRHVLSDWDVDDAPHARAEVLRLTREGVRRLSVHSARQA